MKLIANFKVVIEDGMSDVVFGMEEAEDVKVNMLLTMAKFFSDVEKKVKNTLEKINGAVVVAESKTTVTKPQLPFGDEDIAIEEDAEEVEISDEIEEGGEA